MNILPSRAAAGAATTPSAIARVRGVILAATSSRSRLNVAGSISAKTGVAPRRAIDSAVAQNVKAGQITSSPGPLSSASSTITIASVPLPTPTEAQDYMSRIEELLKCLKSLF